MRLHGHTEGGQWDWGVQGQWRDQGGASTGEALHALPVANTQAHGSRPTAPEHALTGPYHPLLRTPCSASPTTPCVRAPLRSSPRGRPGSAPSRSCTAAGCGGGS